MTDQEHRKSISILAAAPSTRSSSNPFVTTVEIDTSTTENKWITSQAEREDTHTLRHQHDVILVGKQTNLHHNPSLTTRRPRGGHHPIRIVLDSEHTIPITNKILKNQLRHERRGFYVHRNH